MKEKSESLSAADFFEKLQHDQLETTVPFSIIGMVKKSGGQEKTIEFAPGGNCSNWVTIPLEFIEDVEILKTISCKDHTHPLVKLKIKTPESIEGKLFFALLESMKHSSESKPHNPDAPQSMPMYSKPSSLPINSNPSLPSINSKKSPSYSTNSKINSRLGLHGHGGFGGFGGLGGLSAWGCWDSQCCSDGYYQCYDPNSDEATWGPICRWICTAWEPCERCIWPW